MIIMRLILLTALILVMSCIVGVAAVKFFDGKDYGIGKILLYGQLIILASYELVAPFEYLFQRRLLELMIIWGVLLTVLLLISIKYALPTYKSTLNYNIRLLKNENIALKVMVAILVTMQVFFVLWFIVRNNMDDWYWIGEAATEYNTGWINRYSVIQGQPFNFLGETTIKYWLAPWSTFYAVLGKFIGVHPAAIAHLVISGFAMLDMYLVLYQIAKLFFKEKAYRLVFMVVMSIIKYHNNFSYSYFSCYIYLNPWQGKAWMTSIMFPLIFWSVGIIAKKEINILEKRWLLLGIILFDTMLVNSLGTLLGVSIVVCMGMAMVIMKRDIKYITNMIIISIPEILGLLVTLTLKIFH